MRMASMRWTVDGECTAVATDHALRMRENAVEILFAHREADHADVRVISLQQRDGEIIRVDSLLLREGAESRAFGGAVVRIHDVGDHHVVPAADEIDFGERLALDAV